MKFLQIAIISILISLSSSYIIMSLSIFKSPGDVMTGANLIEEVIIAILLGIAIGCISLIFSTERISFSLQLTLHFIAITISVFTAGYFGDWYDLNVTSSIITIFIAIIIVYIVTWGILHILLKKDVHELNKTIRQRRAIKN